MCGDNHYEEVIDKMMLDLIDPKLHGKINSLEHKYKRLAILSLLDKDRKLFTSIKNIVRDNKVTKVNHVKDVIKMLREYVRVGEVEKKKYGEVMTPLELVKDMIQTIPNDLWKNPNSKILDPANGVGPYPWMVIYRLMMGLKDWEPNEEKRYKHIIENMIYVCELQPKNMFLWMVAVDPEDIYGLNIFNGSFLSTEFDDHMKNVWKVEKFDLILGNPPYQRDTTGGNGQRDLWPDFVKKSLRFLEENGYLNFVHPSKWRKPNSDIYKIFKENNLIYLEIHSDKDGHKIFGATTRYDWYVLQKNEYSGKTIVIDEKGYKNIINIKNWNWIPNYNFDLIKSILNNNDNCNVIYSRSLYGNDKECVSKKQSDVFKYPCVYGMYQDLTCSYYYSSIDKGHFGVSKIILGIGRHLYPLIDMDGKYGMTQNAFAIKVDTLEEAEGMKKAIESEKFKEIIKSTKWGNFQTDWKMFQSFKKDFWKEFIND